MHPCKNLFHRYPIAQQLARRDHRRVFKRRNRASCAQAAEAKTKAIIERDIQRRKTTILKHYPNRISVSCGRIRATNQIQRKIGTCGSAASTRSNAGGRGPPVAQSNSSTVCTIGMPLADPICIMQPILPAAIISGFFASILRTFRSRNSLEISGCIKL